MELGFGAVDVRDVADLHLRAMTDSKAKGERFLAVSDDGFVWTKDMAAKLKAGLGEEAKRVPTRVVPNFVVRILGFFDPTVGSITNELGKVKNVTNEKAKSVLGWRPRSTEEALVASAKSLDQFGLIKR